MSRDDMSKDGWKMLPLHITLTVVVKLIITAVYLLVSMRAVIGQLCGPYFTVRAANFENFFFRASD